MFGLGCALAVAQLVESPAWALSALGLVLRSPRGVPMRDRRATHSQALLPMPNQVAFFVLYRLSRLLGPCASPERRARACRRLEDWDVMTPYGRSILGAVSANGYDLRPNDASSLKIGTPRSAPAGGLDAWPVRAPVPPHRVQN